MILHNGIALNKIASCTLIGYECGMKLWFNKLMKYIICKNH